MAVESRDFTRWYAVVRTGLGVVTVAAPGVVGRLWIGEAARRPEPQLVLRALGGRELALGLGLKTALDRGLPTRGWLRGCVIADTVDATAAATARHEIPLSIRIGVAFAAGAWIAAGIRLHREADEATVEEPAQAV